MSWRRLVPLLAPAGPTARTNWPGREHNDHSRQDTAVFPGLAVRVTRAGTVCLLSSEV
ncbi:hypothetical protein [Desulfovibrio sp. DV]|uniref:hypothetical protein n=1 Tax=Desulfovibrio sp. DV TaxID=1844708 RepID=UPI00158818A3|nr:hypothetical protein [Desulfovibrio sp. DV]